MSLGAHSWCFIVLDGLAGQTDAQYAPWFHDLMSTRHVEFLIYFVEGKDVHGYVQFAFKQSSESLVRLSHFKFMPSVNDPAVYGIFCSAFTGKPSTIIGTPRIKSEVYTRGLASLRSFKKKAKDVLRITAAREALLKFTDNPLADVVNLL